MAEAPGLGSGQCKFDSCLPYGREAEWFSAGLLSRRKRVRFPPLSLAALPQMAEGPVSKSGCSRFDSAGRHLDRGDGFLVASAHEAPRLDRGDR